MTKSVPRCHPSATSRFRCNAWFGSYPGSLTRSSACREHPPDLCDHPVGVLFEPDAEFERAPKWRRLGYGGVT